MSKPEYSILNTLLDKYEVSRTFIGENKVKQSFSVRPEEIYPKYLDDAEYDLFLCLNEAVAGLVKKGLVTVKMKHGDIIDKVFLCIDDMEKCYSYVNRVPRYSEQEWLKGVLSEYVIISPKQDIDSVNNKSDVLTKYAKEQLSRIRQNKNVEYYDGNRNKYLDTLKLVKRLLLNEEECFIRDLSIELFGDSKRLEMLSGTVVSLLYKYGEYDTKETVLEECNVLRTPTYVCMKGNAEIGLSVINDGSYKDSNIAHHIYLGEIKGDIAFSTETLRSLKFVNILGKRVVTVENLTSFHDYKAEDDFVVYLGGFHNRAKREFLKLVYEQNPNKEYRHFGDIDAGGFYILEHLRDKTGIPFKPMAMDIATLSRYSSYTKKLTDQDRKRLKNLITRQGVEYGEVLEYMIEHDCKLEQESVIIEAVDLEV